MDDLRELQKVAAQLRELQRTSPSEKTGLAKWDASARKFSETTDVPLPHQVMHYLHDADIRIKDPEYRKYQEEMISKIISDLEVGIVPDSFGTTVLVHPRWLGAVALAIVAIICWVVFW
ncbi:hypothetical protein [Luteimonas sp. A501]